MGQAHAAGCLPFLTECRVGFPQMQKGIEVTLHVALNIAAYDACMAHVLQLARNSLQSVSAAEKAALLTGGGAFFQPLQLFEQPLGMRIDQQRMPQAVLHSEELPVVPGANALFVHADARVRLHYAAAQAALDFACFHPAIQRAERTGCVLLHRFPNGNGIQMILHIRPPFGIIGTSSW